MSYGDSEAELEDARLMELREVINQSDQKIAMFKEAECNKLLRQRVKMLEDALYRAINNLSHFGICRTAQTGNTRDCTCAIAELLQVLVAKEPKTPAVVVVGICKCGHARMEHEPDCVFCDCAAYEFVAKEAKA